MTKNNHAKNAKSKEEVAADLLNGQGEEASKQEASVSSDEEILLAQKDIDDLRAQAAKAGENWDRYLRLQAEFDNVRKRLEKEKAEFQKYAEENLIADFLGILDDLERSVEAAENRQENFEAFLKGIEMILAHLYEILKKRGVVAIPAKGKKFNPLEHEALLQTESAEHADEEVLEEFQKGYRIGDRVIRTAKVRVAKKIEKE